MPKVIGLLCALFALAAAVIGEVATPIALARAAIAFILGVFLAQMWYALLAPRLIERADAGKNADKEPA